MGYNFKKHIILLSLKIDFVLANSADPDEMPQYAAFYLGRHCYALKYQKTTCLFARRNSQKS